MIYAVFKRGAEGPYDALTFEPATRVEKIEERFSLIFNRKVNFYGIQAGSLGEAVEATKKAEAEGRMDFRYFAPARR